MNNFEINKAVAEKLGHKVTVSIVSGMGKSTHNYTSVKELDNGNSYTLPDYCNSWSDAGPIIEKCKISICHLLSGDCEAYSPNYETQRFNDSALVAAMLVFLEMDND